jgi:hypothetical protein
MCNAIDALWLLGFLGVIIGNPGSENVIPHGSPFLFVIRCSKRVSSFCGFINICAFYLKTVKMLNSIAQLSICIAPFSSAIEPI